MGIWAMFGVLVSVVAGLTAFVSWRDSRRSPAGERPFSEVEAWTHPDGGHHGGPGGV